MNTSFRHAVLITGASRGIGRAIASAFARQGDAVFLNFCTHQAEAEALAKELQRTCHVPAIPWQADISSPSEVSSMVDAMISQLGRIDVLVNNAGIAQQKLFTDITEEEWERMYQVNAGGVFRCCRYVLPHMIRVKRGKIINISSIWGMVGASCEVHYSASKAAVIGLTKALAKEVGPSGIQVNCIAPGVINTDMNASLDPEILDALREETPLQTLGTGNDIAGTALFLASPAADFLTGQVISPNGGFVIV